MLSLNNTKFSFDKTVKLNPCLMQFQDRITHGLPTSMSNLKHDPSVPVGVSVQSLIPIFTKII